MAFFKSFKNLMNDILQSDSNSATITDKWEQIKLESGKVLSHERVRQEKIQEIEEQLETIIIMLNEQIEIGNDEKSLRLLQRQRELVLERRQLHCISEDLQELKDSLISKIDDIFSELPDTIQRTADELQFQLENHEFVIQEDLSEEYFTESLERKLMLLKERHKNAAKLDEAVGNPAELAHSPGEDTEEAGESVSL